MVLRRGGRTTSFKSTFFGDAQRSTASCECAAACAYRSRRAFSWMIAFPTGSARVSARALSTRAWTDPGNVIRAARKLGMNAKCGPRRHRRTCRISSAPRASGLQPPPTPLRHLRCVDELEHSARISRHHLHNYTITHPHTEPAQAPTDDGRTWGSSRR